MNRKITPENLRNALYALPPEYATDRGLWLSTIAALHYATMHDGIDPEAGKKLAKEWSQTTTGNNYDDKGFEKAWGSFKETGNIANTGYIIKHALENGFRFDNTDSGNFGEETATAEKPRAIDIDETIDFSGLLTGSFAEEGYEGPDAVDEAHSIEDGLGGQYAEIFRFLDMFGPDERVNIVYNVVEDGDGRKRPGTGSTKTVADWKQILRLELDSGKAPFSSFVSGGYDTATGVWARLNPLDGKGIGDKNVTSFRYALLESDEIPKDKQMELLKKMGAPYRLIVDSGNKSLHAIIKVDAENAKDYAEKVSHIYDVAEKLGLFPDRQDKNPSRLTRLPGIRRGNGFQKIVYEGDPATIMSYDDWDTTLTFGMPVDPSDAWDDWDPAKELSPVLIDGVLRQGHKLLVTGPSKAGKSFGLIELAAALVSGGKWWGMQCRKSKVIYINFEIDGKSFVNRIHKVFEAMCVKPETGMIRIFNLRGKPCEPDDFVKHVSKFCEKKDIGAIIIDPIYKLMLGDDENSAKDIGRLCSNFDKLAANIGASVIYCHHYSKGNAYNKASMDVADRGSGSGVFGRDADAIITLTQLDYEAPVNNPDETAWRVDSVLREFAPLPPFGVYFDYPIHIVDPMGTLMELRYKGDPQKMAADRRGEEISDEAADNVLTLSNRLRALFTTHDGDTMRETIDGRPAIHWKKVAEKYDYNAKTLRRYLTKLAGFEIVNGYIYSK